MKKVSFLKRARVKRRVSFKAEGKPVHFTAEVRSKRRKRVRFLARERR